MAKKIAVIGAGPNGLSALKVFRDYGHTVILFEKEDSIGGLWNYRDDGALFAVLSDPSQRINSCYSSLSMNTCKRMNQFSDYPAADSLSSFMRHAEFLHYMQDYAAHFNLNDHINFKSKVTRLYPVRDTSSAGYQWQIFYEKENIMEMKVFDKVVVASGPFPNVHLPEYLGMDQFQGIMIHSAQVRRDDIFDSKRILIVGGSFSAAEMIDIALKAGVKDLYWSLSSTPQSKNRWMFDRFPADSRSWDENVTRHDYLKKPEIFSSKFASWLQPISQRENDPLFKCPPDRLTITNTTDVHKGLLSGRVRKVAPIKSFSQYSVLLTDNVTIDNVDIVIYCTGFVSRFPFLDDLWSIKQQSEAVLYHHMLPVESHLHGIAFVGLPYTLTALFPTAEMQSRWLAHSWATRTYNPNGTLYSEKETQDFQAEIKKRIDSLNTSEPYNFLLDSYGYVEALAKEIGCQPPDIESLLTTDKEFALALLHGPLIAAQYRIAGPHSWAGARDYIIKTAQEMFGHEKWQKMLKLE